MPFDPVSETPDLPALQREVQAFWESTGAFDELRRQNAEGPVFAFLDGPITANNPMGVHHARGRALKDVYQRLMAMRGRHQRYQNGFDCHGLWVEVEVEKALGLADKRAVHEYGLERFARACRDRVSHFAEVQTRQSRDLGQWMDWGSDYYTMSTENIEGIWRFLRTCHNRGWLVRAARPMPWCPRCGTSLSQHELLEAYAEVTHQAVTVKLPLTDRPGHSLLVWTTTPWTLPANVALAVHPDLTYACVTLGEETLVLAQGCQGVLAGHPVACRVQGRDLVGLRYRMPFRALPAQEGVEHRVVAWDAVADDEGTGVVHIAPGCGLEDFEVARAQGLPVVPATGEDGRYLEGFGEFSGRPVADVARAAVERLREERLLHSAGAHTHRYPRCWRCDTELIYRLVDEWFLRVDEVRGDLLRANDEVDWRPSYMRARMADWLTLMGDWCISRKRFWGVPLPFYVCGACGHTTVVGSREELASLAGIEGSRVSELHRPWLDEVTIRCPACRAEVARVPEVGDCWLDAGIVPFSTLGYFSSDPLARAAFDRWFPAELVVEMRAQVRCWFYALLFMSVVLTGRPPYRRVLAYETVLAEDGREMHKSWGNAIWLDDAVEVLGADALRWLYVTQRHDLPLRFGLPLGREVTRRLLTLWSSYRFYVLYANVDEPALAPYDTPPTRVEAPLDRWMLSRLDAAVAEAGDALDELDTRRAALAIEDCWGELSRWYIRRSRRRLWRSGGGEDKAAALAVLRFALVTLARLLAPFLPYLAEAMYQNLVARRDPSAPCSVHHTPYPASVPGRRDQELEVGVVLVQEAVALGTALRKQHGVRVRQPLREALVVAPLEHHRWLEALSHDIRDELNVKQLGVTASPPAGGPEGWAITERGRVTVALWLELDGELVLEGLARDLVRRLQNLRREAGLDLTERVRLTIAASRQIAQACAAHGQGIRAEILADSLDVVTALPRGATARPVRVGGEEVAVALERVVDGA